MDNSIQDEKLKRQVIWMIGRKIHFTGTSFLTFCICFLDNMSELSSSMKDGLEKVLC